MLAKQVLALVACPAGGPGPWVALFIDGIFRGEAAGVGTCPNGWTSESTDASFAQAPADAEHPAGEPTQAWPGGAAAIGSDLTMRHPIVWPECSGQNRTLSAGGNWSSGGNSSSLRFACCTPCPTPGAGPAQTSVGPDRSTNASCTCNAGYTGPNGGGPCSACPMGKYKDTKGDQQCSTCAYGRFTLAEASVVCTDPICKACPTNAISDEASPGLSNCKCQAGFYGNASQGMACTVCPAGSNGQESATARADCVCNQGYYGDPAQNITCRACPANSAPNPSVVSPRYIQDCVCNAGHYGNPTPFSDPACQACPSDTYNANLGMPALANCTACPPNSTSPLASAGRGSCMCDRGFFGNLASDGVFCEQCPLGTYGPTQGALSEGMCRFCPPNSAARFGSVAVSVFDCACNQGYQGVFNSTHQFCYACPNFNCTQLPRSS